MADWFQFKNIKSTTMGVYVTSYPPITFNLTARQFMGEVA